ncbi:LINE-1 retrotransposable element ORF2 protein [Camelus dromedarius]|uniref:LINE-1 retrotransposable element ORF2 protein n=1 Tax=Camelus dromedarius TaxID=9838 RepID=A0A5N4DZ36_CAMDR|nr:LINE-1 retrotransposable element ORF2 protein [Camelus dromedarius]
MQKDLPGDLIYADAQMKERRSTALFTIAKTWKQPKCPSTDDWIKKMWYIYTTEYYSAIKMTT